MRGRVRTVIHVSIVTAALAGPSLPAVCKAEGCPNSGQQSIGPDVIVGDIMNNASPNISQYTFATIDGVDYESYSMSTVSCNLGDTHLIWIDEGGANTHPVISQNLFRLKNVDGARRFEHMAQAWLKHGFCALCGGVCCNERTSESCDYLGVGCSDPYNSSRNGSQTTDIGPKWQVNATTGVHAHPVANPPGGSATTVSRRMHIRITDLEFSNGSGDVNATRYFGEAHYVSADDAVFVSGPNTYSNKNNNASYRPVQISGGGTVWTFGSLGTTQRQQAGIRAWADTDTTASIPDVITRVVETDVTTPEDDNLSALVIIAAQATKLPGGKWRFEYAIQNLNSHRSIYSYAVPVSNYAWVENIGFRDVDYWDGDGINDVTTDGTDWPGVRGGGAVSWTVVQTFDDNPNGNALRWATLYNFRFDCDVGPSFDHGDVALGDVTLQQFKTGAQTITAQSVRPGAVVCLRGDVSGDGFIDGGDIARFAQILVNGSATATARERCAGDLENTPDFGIDDGDIDNFSNCLLAGGGC
jgi:hypothetical protein